MEQNVPLAFLLVIIAGLSTGIGASAIFCKRCVFLANKKFLAGSLGLSAGVMLYVSFVEILQKSLDGFSEGGLRGDSGSGPAYMAGTGCLFSGMLIMWLLNVFVHSLDKPHLHSTPAAEGDMQAKRSGESSSAVPTTVEENAIEIEISHTSEAIVQGSGNVQNDTRLSRMGFLTALAIGIHNFPEGLATFVATLADPTIGVALTVAIGIHNIPEGLCVAVPVYYSTGSKWKALCWALLSGVSEPIGALLGYLVLKDIMGPVAFGIIFGLVGGMMIYICFRELIPTAHRYDPDDTIVTPSIVFGMAIMALSLVLFASEPAEVEGNPCVNITCH